MSNSDNEMVELVERLRAELEREKKHFKMARDELVLYDRASEKANGEIARLRAERDKIEKFWRAEILDNEQMAENSRAIQSKLAAERDGFERSLTEAVVGMGKLTAERDNWEAQAEEYKSRLTEAEKGLKYLETQYSEEVHHLRAEVGDYKEALQRVTWETPGKVAKSTIESAALATRETAKRCVEICEEIAGEVVGDDDCDDLVRGAATDCAAAIKAEFGGE